MTIHYTVAIDYDDDGAYDDLGEAITADVLALHWRLGMTRPYEHFAAPAWAKITVRNRDGSYSPERSSALAGKPLRILSDDGSNTRIHFTGFIEEVEPESGEQGSQQANIIALGYGAQLSQNPARLPAQANRRADQAIRTLLTNGEFRYPVLDGYCILDRAGHNVINSTKIFAAQAIETQLEPGKSIFAYLGDDWDDALTLAEAVEILARSEGGRFFFDREGRATFHNRHHSLVDESIAASFSDDMEGLHYRYGDARITEVQTRTRSRVIGAANTLLWSLDQPLELARESTLQLTVSYTIDEQPVAALHVIQPRANLHYQANDEQGDVTALLSVRLLQAGFRAATLEIRNRSRRSITLLNLSLYGTPLILGDWFTVTESRALERSVYGLRMLALELPAVSSMEEAAAVARYELLRRGSPRGTLHQLAISTRSHPQTVLRLTLIDKVNISESQTGHSGTYVILAEEHLVDQGGARHHATYLLEPDEAERFFVVNRHTIDGERVLIPR